jgi:hypothetical protein
VLLDEVHQLRDVLNIRRHGVALVYVALLKTLQVLEIGVKQGYYEPCCRRVVDQARRCTVGHEPAVPFRLGPHLSGLRVELDVDSAPVAGQVEGREVY